MSDSDSLAATIAEQARAASRNIARLTTQERDRLLRHFADALVAQRAGIAAANREDEARADDLSAALRERLHYDEDSVIKTAAGIQQIIQQPDPIGSIDDLHFLPSGIQLGKMRVPLGVILMIYESRPGVTADAAALALKSGNAIILRGGSEAKNTNRAIGACLESALAEFSITAAAQVVIDNDRKIIGGLLQQSANIDLVIPRGGRALIERVANESKIAVLKHLDGNCHVYVDESADLNMALTIIDNAKNRRYGVCNAAESLLLHESIATQFLPPLTQRLAEKQVEMRVCAACKSILNDSVQTTDASEDDWASEYLAPIVSIKIVESLTAAISHINHYGSGHTDAIITNDIASRDRFLREVDSSSVMVNASTAFADGGEYGMGAEVGISTDKLHARGPVGILGLTSQKFIVLGHGETRE